MEKSATSQLPDETRSSSDAPSAAAIARGYETTHLSVRTVVFVLVGLAGVCAAIYTGVWHLQHELLDSAAAEDQSKSMVHFATRDNDAPLLQPSGPIHDTTPAQDLVIMHANEDAIFAHLGWRNPETGDVSAPADIVHALASRRESASRPSNGDEQ
jgi:hypothetical protein